jgi:hypothetical protein
MFSVHVWRTGSCVRCCRPVMRGSRASWPVFQLMTVSLIRYQLHWFLYLLVLDITTSIIAAILQHCVYVLSCFKEKQAQIFAQFIGLTSYCFHNSVTSLLYIHYLLVVGLDYKCCWNSYLSFLTSVTGYANSGVELLVVVAICARLTLLLSTSMR